MTSEQLTSEQLLDRTIAAIEPVSAQVRAEAEDFQLGLTKPPHSLGELEDLGVRLCAIAGECPPPLPAPAFVAVFAGDHGVQDHRVSPWPQAITYEMGANMAAGGAAVSVLSRHAGADLTVYNVGALTDLPEGPHIVNCALARGTADLSQGPAMTREQTLDALGIGITAAAEAAASGHKAIVPGELGIANTTPAAALIAAYTGADVELVTGRGSGADDEMLARKVAAIRSGLAVNQVDQLDALGVLAAVGGFEHAAMAGSMLGGAAAGLPVVIDGVIAASAALAAVRLCPNAQGYLFAGHRGAEPGIGVALEALELSAILQLGMCLGEGSGAVTALPVLVAAAKIMREMATFESAGVSSEHD
ncbi:nicotinate-nucleotide--dimethylbenzimidazole phosphoribosyltransferase [Propionibacterium cyclohexanicum]|uniref:Nicotinate-nucleotide--dimethylbenzimidazole phosphoribosyltransferase n=1 Tax=Propionibacterium cyclohexanicum TaxID=64702 RepID=A0A1H9TZF1_9ACTN|nr:nicotinate-nucleotide--dimethylbenzimidazole phosphoribosyltransferase [Propionibacterium cyclohexanicum]SES02780.1 nicotinate-nucleotide--dimethylbenzimidazole phosphoribosyltransferase [Propionibacterium cyclohexanicum]